MAVVLKVGVKRFSFNQQSLINDAHYCCIRPLTSVSDTSTLLYPYTAERRDVLGNTSPEAREISQGPRGAKSTPEGNLEGRGGCISQCIPTRGSVRPFSQH